jgi:cytochrome oxidase Cu insertion factor (SCO1/SenC/PrrC family)
MLLRVITIVSLLFVSVSGVVGAQTRPTTQKPATKQVVYACPMHPDVTSTKPGRCPKCGMDLRLKTQAPPAPTNEEIAASFSSDKIPNTSILDQNARQLNFYNDLIKGKIVAINFIFTTCTASCPALTATFRRVQQSAKERGLDINLISVSVDPSVDTPERLRAFAEKYNAGPGWTFVTGDKGKIDSLLQSLGVAVANKNDHTPMVLIGNDVADYWTRAYGLSSPSKIVDLLADAQNRTR